MYDTHMYPSEAIAGNYVLHHLYMMSRVEVVLTFSILIVTTDDLRPRGHHDHSNVILCSVPPKRRIQYPHEAPEAVVHGVFRRGPTNGETRFTGEDVRAERASF